MVRERVMQLPEGPRANTITSAEEHLDIATSGRNTGVSEPQADENPHSEGGVRSLMQTDSMHTSLDSQSLGGSHSMAASEVLAANTLEEKAQNKPFDPARFGFGFRMSKATLNSSQVAESSHQRPEFSSNRIQLPGILSTTLDTSLRRISGSALRSPTWENLGEAPSRIDQETAAMTRAIQESAQTYARQTALMRLGESSRGHSITSELNSMASSPAGNIEKLPEQIEKGKGRQEWRQGLASELTAEPVTEIHVLLVPNGHNHAKVFVKNIQTATSNLRFHSAGYGINAAALLQTIRNEPSRSFLPHLQNGALLVATSRRFFSNEGYDSILNGYQTIGQLDVLLSIPPVIWTEVLSVDQSHPETTYLQAMNCEPRRVFVLFLHDTPLTTITSSSTLLISAPAPGPTIHSLTNRSDQSNQYLAPSPALLRGDDTSGDVLPPVRTSVLENLLPISTMPTTDSVGSGAIQIDSDLAIGVAPQAEQVLRHTHAGGALTKAEHIVGDALLRQTHFISRNADNIYSALSSIFALAKVLARCGLPSFWGSDWNKPSATPGTGTLAHTELYQALGWNPNTLKQRRALYTRAKDLAFEISAMQHNAFIHQVAQNQMSSAELVDALTLYNCLPSLLDALTQTLDGTDEPLTISDYLRQVGPELQLTEDFGASLIEVSTWSIRRFTTAVGKLRDVLDAGT